MEKIFSTYAPTAFIKYKPVIRKTINAVSREYYLHHDAPINSTHARTVDINLINEVARKMWEGNIKEKQCSLVLWITHYTGTRTSEVLQFQWQDFKEEITSCGKFWKFHIRSSKSNMIPTETEQATIKLEPNKRHFQKRMNKYRKYLNFPKDGFIFDQNWAKTTNVRYILLKYSKLFDISPPLTAHSGRNFCLQQAILAGIPESTIKTFMRWKDNSQMYHTYKNITLECTNKGCAHLLGDFNF